MYWLYWICFPCHVTGAPSKHLRGTCLKVPACGKLHFKTEAKSNLTAKQISGLHELDDRHYEKLHGQSKMRSCEKWSEMQERDPDHWFINNEGAASYVDCLCEAKEPSLVCYARHKSGIQSAMLAFSEKLSTSFDVPPNRVAKLQLTSSACCCFHMV